MFAGTVRLDFEMLLWRDSSLTCVEDGLGILGS
jgi:hypothetical protein